jgi:hypothetical protein
VPFNPKSSSLKRDYHKKYWVLLKSRHYTGPMDSHGSSLPWSSSIADTHQASTRRTGSFSMNSRPMSQPTGPPRPTGTIVQVCADVKPRLTKEQHEILERHFQAQPKPSTSTKKGFADALGVPLDKINVSLIEHSKNSLNILNVSRTGSRTDEPK